MAQESINKALSDLFSLYEIDKKVGIDSKYIAQYVISSINSLYGLREKLINKQDNQISAVIKDDLFEKCWQAYRRKGSKAKSKTYWKKLTEEEKQRVLPHIKVYVSVRDISYQKDFERYLRDKIFDTVIVNGKDIVYDPTCGTETEYHPYGNLSIMYDEINHRYIYTAYDFNMIADGYTDDERPDGAVLVLNSGRGTLTWSKAERKWIHKN